MNKYIDHTILKPNAKKEDVQKICQEAIKYNFMSVCINPTHVAYAAELLKDAESKVCTVIGFPLGANTPIVKAFETNDAILNGADEIDMVVNIGAVKDGNWELIKEDISAVVEAANGTLVKVILETCYLTDNEKIKTCKIAKEVGADFVKTSTGFGTGGATKEDIALMRKTVGPDMGVKASGGVRSGEDFETMVKAGATRIGASSGVLIMQGKKAKTDY